MKIKVWMVLLTIITAAGTANAQINFFTSSIFHNKVVFNPSQAGLGVDGGFRINGVFRTPMNNSVAGLAKDYAATADMAISETAGAGLGTIQAKCRFIEPNTVQFRLCLRHQAEKRDECADGFWGGV